MCAQGVFIKGEVVPGTVIALFPGIIHLAEFARGKDYMKSLMPDDNFNLLMRYYHYHDMLLTFLCTNTKSPTASQSEVTIAQYNIRHFMLLIAYLS